MNDPKAAAAYRPGDAPVVGPDLDVLAAQLESIARRGDSYSDDGGFLIDDEDAATCREAIAVLAAERARADQAEQRIADAPHSVTCLLMRAGSRAVHTCTCWKSAAPTAEHP